MTQHLLPQEVTALVEGLVPEADRERIARHVASCALCQAERDALAGVVQAVRDLPRAAEPGRDVWPAIAAQVQPGGRSVPRSGASQLGAPRLGAPRLPWWSGMFAKRRSLAMELAVLLLVVGVGVTLWMAPWRSVHEEDASNARVRQLLAGPDSWQRLEGVRLAAELPQVDPRTTAALLDVLRQDDNNNVRLAVVTVLRWHSDDPEVQRAVGQALLEQQSPVVQMEILIEVLALRPADARSTLRQKLADESLQPAVRSAIETALMELEP